MLILGSAPGGAVDVGFPAGTGGAAGAASRSGDFTGDAGTGANGCAVDAACDAGFGAAHAGTAGDAAGGGDCGASGVMLLMVEILVSFHE